MRTLGKFLIDLGTLLLIASHSSRQARHAARSALCRQAQLRYRNQ